MILRQTKWKIADIYRLYFSHIARIWRWPVPSLLGTWQYTGGVELQSTGRERNSNAVLAWSSTHLYVIWSHVCCPTKPEWYPLILKQVENAQIRSKHVCYKSKSKMFKQVCFLTGKIDFLLLILLNSKKCHMTMEEKLSCCTKNKEKKKSPDFGFNINTAPLSFHEGNTHHYFHVSHL